MLSAEMTAPTANHVSCKYPIMGIEMTKFDSSVAQERLANLVSRARSGDRGALEAIGGLVELRRAPTGAPVVVLRGAPEAWLDLRNEHKVQLTGIMDLKREAKRKRYIKMKSDPAYRGPRILAEGDSWFEYPACFKDMIDWLGETYAILSLAKAGDTWQGIAQEEGGHYGDGTPMGLFENLRIEQPDIVMLSVGGNEIMGKIESYVRDWHAGWEPKDYIRPEFNDTLDYVETMYRSYVSQIVPHAKVILHTYDYPDPRRGEQGHWIGGPLENWRKIGDATLWRGISNLMLSQFVDRLARVAGEFPTRTRLVNNLGVIGTADVLNGPGESLWANEIHGNSEGTRRLSTRVAEAINQLASLPVA